jgi:hypothetical protein
MPAGLLSREPEKEMFNELATTLRQHIQRGGATPGQKPNP